MKLRKEVHKTMGGGATRRKRREVQRDVSKTSLLRFIKANPQEKTQNMSESYTLCGIAAAAHKCRGYKKRNEGDENSHEHMAETP